jgi:hypothetical protein
LPWLGGARGLVWIWMVSLPLTVHADPPANEVLLHGQALFSGAIDLQGRIATHLVDLPPAVVRCTNCHAAADGPSVPRSLAPRLTRDLLLEPQPRRGGPASRYDSKSFCTLLRRGIDPAWVLISVEMPRYALDDASCGALWQYLTRGAKPVNPSARSAAAADASAPSAEPADALAPSAEAADALAPSAEAAHVD